MPKIEISDGAADLEEQPPASKLINRRLVGVDDTGEVSIAFEARAEFTNRHGTVQGGFLAAMLDSATAFTLLMALPVDQTAVTARLETTFVKPAHPGALMAHARILKRNERHATVVAALKTPEGVVVARAQASLRILPRR